MQKEHEATGEFTKICLCTWQNDLLYSDIYEISLEKHNTLYKRRSVYLSIFNPVRSHDHAAPAPLRQGKEEALMAWPWKPIGDVSAPGTHRAPWTGLKKEHRTFLRRVCRICRRRKEGRSLRTVSVRVQMVRFWLQPLIKESLIEVDLTNGFCLTGRPLLKSLSQYPTKK